MSEDYGYYEDDLEDEISDEEDEMRMAILEAEANEIWLEEPGDEEDEVSASMNPLLGFLPINPLAGFPGNFKDSQEEGKQNNENPEH